MESIYFLDTMKIKEKIKVLSEDRNIAEVISRRIKEFEGNYRKGSKRWFKELCFCLLTANFKAQQSIEICTEECKSNAFIKYSREDLSEFLKRQKYRFPNTRAGYIVEARKYAAEIKNVITGFDSEKEAREWLVKNVKGIGYKEASHFLRNVGYKDVAILDRHILKVLYENRIIPEIPGQLSKKTYLMIENLVQEIADDLKISLAELDLFLWYMKTGRVLK